MEADEEDKPTLADSDVVAAVSRARLTFDVAGCENLPEKSRLALEQVAAHHAKTVLKEAGRLEAAINPGLNEPMITPTHIADADTWVRRGYSRLPEPLPRKSKKAKVLTGCSYLIAIICGYFVNNIDKPWGAIGVAVLLLCGATTFFLGEVKNE